jgi:hypothetical protein
LGKLEVGIFGLNVKSGLIVFIVFLVVSLTPAFAIQMEEVEKDAKDYEIESKEKKGFFGKIKLMVKGFKLVNKVKKAEKESDEENKDKESSNEVMYQEMVEQDRTSNMQKQQLLNFKNNKTDTDNVSGIVQSNTNTANHTNNITNNQSNNGINPMIIPRACYEDVQKMATKLQAEGIEISTDVQSEVNSELNGKIVQIIDENGELRYAYIESITSNSNSTVTLQIDENKKIVMELDDFKKAYTGITLNFGTQNPGNIITKIIQTQKNILEKQKKDTEERKTNAEDDHSLGNILLGVGIGLIVVAIILAIYIYCWAEEAVTEMAARLGFYTATFGGQDVSARVATMADAAVAMGAPSFADALFVIASFGVNITFQIALQMWIDVISGSWLHLVLCIVAIVFVIAGIALIITGVIFRNNSHDVIESSDITLTKIDGRFRYLESWLNRGQVIHEITGNNSDINIQGNKTETYNNLTQTLGQNTSFPV